MRRAVGSLRGRLTIVYALVLAGVLVVLLAAMNIGVEQVLIDNTAGRLAVGAGLVSTTRNADGPPTSSLSAVDAANAIGSDQTAVTVLDGAGQVIAATSNGAPPEVIAARLDPATYGNLVSTGGRITVVEPASEGSGDRVLVVAAGVRLSDSQSGNSNGSKPGNGHGLGLGHTGASTGPSNAVVQLSVSLSQIDAAVTGLRLASIALAAAVLVLAIALMLLLTRASLGPLRRVADAADRIAAGDLSARSRLPAGEDEIGRLGRAFDRMAERLDASTQTQRQFAADASHELRSPLTVLGGYVDVLGQGQIDEPATRTRALAAMRTQIDRLSRLAADLLMLTQIEAGGGHLQPQRVDLGEVAVDVAEATQAMAGGRRVEVERSGQVPVLADPDRLSQVLLNLVDNAVRHTPADGLIRVSVRREGRFGTAEVMNTGSTIAAEDLPKIFDRFYRTKHSSPAGDGHTGLGLAIVRAIVEASGGTVSAASDDEGTRFVVRLPLTDPPLLQPPFSEGTTERQVGTVS